MGLFNISRVCFALFLASAITSVLAADPPVPRSNVSATLNPTTGYYSSTNSTVRLPSGVSASPSGGLPVVTRYAGGLQQTIPTGVTINALKQSAPLPAVVRASTSAVKGAATRCLTSGKCNVGLMLAGAGLNQFMNGLGWVMGEGGQITKKVPFSDPMPCVDGSACYQALSPVGGPAENSQTAEGACTAVYAHVTPKTCSTTTSNGSYIVGLRLGGIGECAVEMEYRVREGLCEPADPFYINITKYNSGFEPEPTYAPVPASDISDAVNSNYNPDPTDWPAITPQLPLDDVQIGSPPSFQGDPTTTTEKDAQGNPTKVTEKTIHFEFDVKDNPSPQPALDLKVNEDTKTFEDGVLTGSSSTTNTVPAGSAGSGGSEPPELDIPTDCDFMPTVCAFLEWYKDDDLGDDPDLRSIMKEDEDFAKTKVISFGAAVCPQPYTIHISSLSMSVDLSFEFFCQFAEYARALVLAAAYIFAAYISLGVARG